jgi:hypothetical protein
MKDRNKPPTLHEIASAFFEIPEAELPTDTQVLQEGLIAEAVRLSLAASKANEKGWKTRHVLSLRTWVRRKLRALIPEVESPSSESDVFLQTLREGRGANLVFLGDVIELANGYYAPAPTRVVPITDDVSLLVSGLPTGLFARQGLNIRVTGISRAIRASAASLQSEFNIPIQDRATYIGLMGSEGFDERTLGAFLQSEERQSWAEAGDWSCYQGNRRSYGFDHWGSRDYAVSSPFGLLSLWKASEGFGAPEYWLRIRHQGDDEIIRMPRQLLRQSLLLLDQWGKSPREVLFLESPLSTVIKTQFPPPAAQMRWIHAVGGRWMGSKDNWIRWEIPPDTVESTMDVFDKLPVTIKRGRQK